MTGPTARPGTAVADEIAGPAAVPAPAAGAGPGAAARRVAAPVAVAGLATAAVAFVAAVDPNQPGHYPTCPFLFVTGLYCPGCGSLRALHALGHGDVAGAVDHNVLLVVTLPFLLAAWVSWFRRSWTGRPRRMLVPPQLVHLLLVAVLGYWVLRNLPGLPWLAP